MALFGSSAVPVGPLALRPRIAPGLPLSERTKFYILSSRLSQALFLCQQINQELPDKRNRDSGICKQERTDRRGAVFDLLFQLPCFFCANLGPKDENSKGRRILADQARSRGESAGGASGLIRSNSGSGRNLTPGHWKLSGPADCQNHDIWWGRRKNLSRASDLLSALRSFSAVTALKTWPKPCLTRRRNASGSGAGPGRLPTVKLSRWKIGTRNPEWARPLRSQFQNSWLPTFLWGFKPKQYFCSALLSALRSFSAVSALKTWP